MFISFRRVAHGPSLIVALAAFAVPACAQDATNYLAQFRSSDYTKRAAAFYSVLSLANQGYPANENLGPRCARLASYSKANPAVATALVGLLERETERDPAKDALPEDAYLGDLIGCVAELGDPRAANGLVAVVNTGNMAEEGLVSLGQAAVLPLLGALASPQRHSTIRSGAARVLGDIAGQRKPGIDTLAIERGLVTALSDPSLYVREYVIGALGAFHGADVRRAVEPLLTSDKGSVVLKGQRQFPVRAAAASWLRVDDSLKAIRKR
jgi:HEAT repeat protein